MKPGFAVRAAVLVALVTVAVSVAVPAAWSGTSAKDPLARHTWQPYEGPHDALWSAYAAAHGHHRKLLGNLALKPRALFIGGWVPSSGIKAYAQQVVQGTQRGNPNALTEFATFELHPWENTFSGRGYWNVPDAKRWYRGLAAGIGKAPALVILQFDLPFAAKTPNQQPDKIDTFGAKVLSKHRRTSVYIDAGAYQWLPPAEQGALLISNGIRFARGFSVNDTQYGSTGQELEYGAQIESYLQSRGITGKRFIVNTTQNGSPYLAGQVSVESNDTPRCATPHQTLCQRTGIPPTTDVTNPRWHLSAGDAAIAGRYVDAYVWASDPWNSNAGPFSLGYALKLGANGEY